MIQNQNEIYIPYIAQSFTLYMVYENIRKTNNYDVCVYVQ